MTNPKECVEAAEEATEYCRENIGMIETQVLASPIAKAIAPLIERAFKEGIDTAVMALGDGTDPEWTYDKWLESAARAALASVDVDEEGDKA